jgi:hypothetical protein
VGVEVERTGEIGGGGGVVRAEGENKKRWNTNLENYAIVKTVGRVVYSTCAVIERILL